MHLLTEIAKVTKLVALATKQREALRHEALNLVAQRRELAKGQPTKTAEVMLLDAKVKALFSAADSAEESIKGYNSRLRELYPKLKVGYYFIQPYREGSRAQALLLIEGKSITRHLRRGPDGLWYGKALVGEGIVPFPSEGLPIVVEQPKISEKVEVVRSSRKERKLAQKPSRKKAIQRRYLVEAGAL